MQPQIPPHEMTSSSSEAEPTFGGLIRFLWSRRVRLVSLFFFFAGISLVGLLLWRFVIAAPVAEGTLALTFRGMERHEYPSGKKFSVEDIRSPDVLARARQGAGISPDTTDLLKLYVGIEIAPVIPPEVQARWRRQDLNGAKREEFLPSEFRIRVSPKGLKTDQKIQLLTTLVKAYQDDVKFQQEASLRRVADISMLDPAELIKNYDAWDLPALLRVRETDFRQQIETLVKESREFPYPRFGVSFRDIRNDLSLWRSTQLDSLTALVYRGRLVRDRDLMIKRLQERITDLNLQEKQLNGEADQETKLIESLEKSRPALAGPLTNREGAPLVDSSALEKIVRADYIGPVVRRITDLLRQAREVEAERGRCEAQLALLMKGDGATGTPPPGFGDLVAGVTKELGRILGKYNQVLDEYLTAIVTSQVTLREGPRITREGPSPSLLAASFLVLSAILSLAVVLFDRAFREG